MVDYDSCVISSNGMRGNKTGSRATGVGNGGRRQYGCDRVSMAEEAGQQYRAMFVCLFVVIVELSL